MFSSLKLFLVTTEIFKLAFIVFTKMCNYIHNILYVYLYIIKFFNLRFINYLEGENLWLIFFPTSSVSKRIKSYFTLVII